PTTPTYSLSLHDALPIFFTSHSFAFLKCPQLKKPLDALSGLGCTAFSTRFFSASTFLTHIPAGVPQAMKTTPFVRRAATRSMARDRKSTRLNSSHVKISY